MPDGLQRFDRSLLRDRAYRLLRDAIVSGKPSPITYNSPKPKEITDEDKLIESYKIVVKPRDVVIIPVERVFQ